VNGARFHAGELEAQARVGGGPRGHGLRSFMPEQHREFFQMLPYAAVASVQGGWPFADLLAGAPGFISSPDPVTLRVLARHPFQQGAPAGLLGIDLSTRRRNRANGVISSADESGFTLDVQQSFGNCPKYIHVRDGRLQAGGEKETLAELDAGARTLISRADTFFVASSAPDGVDISHRGGPAGFVRVQGDTLVIPDYSGNRYFNTLGNLVSNPRAALLFLDFESGRRLHLQGTVEIAWDAAETHLFPGAERLWRLRVHRGFRSAVQ
jgi:uncharacterized protein